MSGFAFDEQGMRRIEHWVQQSERAPRIGSRRRRQPPVLGGGLAESTPQGGVPCGCGKCFDPEDMTVDFGSAWLAAPTYLITTTELNDDGGGVWSSDTFTVNCGGISGTAYWKLTVVGVEPGQVTLQLLTASHDVIATYQNTVTMWKPNCGVTLQIVSQSPTHCEGFQAGCSICVTVDEASLA